MQSAALAIRLLCAVVVFLLLAPAAAEPSRRLMEDRSLERNIIALDLKYDSLADLYQIYEDEIEKAIHLDRIEELETQFHEIAFLMRVQTGQPFFYRHLYNEMYDLAEVVRENLALVDMAFGMADANIRTVGKSLKDFESLPAHRLSPNTHAAIDDIRRKFAALDERMQRWRQRIGPFRDRLRALNDRLEVALDELQEDIPRVLAYFFFVPENHLLQPLPWIEAPVYWKAWTDGLTCMLGAKLPDSPVRLGRFLAVFGAVALPVFLIGWWIWRRKAAPLLAGRPAARRSLAAGAILLLAGAVMAVAASNLEFPGRMSSRAVQTLCISLGAQLLAWGLRGLREQISGPSPLSPLFWLFAAIVAAEFMGAPLLLASMVWPLLLVLGAWACRRATRRGIPSLERAICRISVWLLPALAVACVFGMVFPTMLAAMAWFVVSVGLQFGVALSRIIRERLTVRYAEAGRFSLSLLSGLASPVLWMALLLAFAYWAVEQFGQLGLLARFIEIDKAAGILLTLLMVLFAERLLTSLSTFYAARSTSRKRPIKGYVQLGKLFVFIVGAVLLACLLMDKSPWAVLGGIGAMTAVLLLVFKDTILALVASIQIVADDLVRIGDWIEMKQHGVDGDVIDVTLHTIKVQNFDKTISTVPTYKLISESFRNWRGMLLSGGRRIKRKVLLDQATVRFLDRQALERLARIELLAEYFTRIHVPEPPADPVAAMRDPATLNHPQMTNAGAFRAYVIAWLSVHPLVRKDMTMLARYLEPTIDGLPFEIYVFAADTNWTTYESIQADVLDHVESCLSMFGLRVAQRPGLAHDPDPGLAGEAAGPAPPFRS